MDSLVTKIAGTIEQVARAAPQLHTPEFSGNEWEYVKECLDTGWVSTAGSYVTEFEKNLCSFTGASHTIATVNGTAALHAALLLSGVSQNDEVLIPGLTFVATANAVSYLGAVPHLVDIEERSLGLSPQKLNDHLEKISTRSNNVLINKTTGRRICAVVAMHTFGHSVDLDPLMQVCQKYNLTLVEDAAESLGSWYNNRHTGTIGRLGVLSFNGNKVLTTGGGGAILVNDPNLAAQARHLTTTAKVQHEWEYIHDGIGYNYRLPNLNAALGCAQLERLPNSLIRKRRLAAIYRSAFRDVEEVELFREPDFSHSNYWLNAIILSDKLAPWRDKIIEACVARGLQVRPAWMPLHKLEMFNNGPRAELKSVERIYARLINVPSSAALAGSEP